MLANKDLHDEITKIDEVAAKTKDEYQKSMLKGTTLLLKLLHSIRSNQVLLLKKQGVELIKPKSKDTDYIKDVE